jgi:hypothetical protein
MLEILQYIYSVLSADSTLTAIVPVGQILTGPVDITMQTQASLLYPQINIHVVSEVQRSNPLETRDTQIQIDIWSRNSQLEIENIYEQVITDLAYDTANKNTAHIFWSRLAGSVDVYETGGTRRVWHRSMTFSFWTLKPND